MQPASRAPGVALDWFGVCAEPRKFRRDRRGWCGDNRLLDAYPETKGLFVVWDEPAMLVVAAMRNRAIELPMTTVDLGNNSALELADGTLIKGIGAQRPYDQGVAAAEATIHSLLGNEMPPWIALPGLSVQPDNVVEAYQVVWHLPAAPSLISARRGARARRSAIFRDRN